MEQRGLCSLLTSDGPQGPLREGGREGMAQAGREAGRHARIGERAKGEK